MNPLSKACFGALLVLALAGIDPASARDYRWNPACHCWSPVTHTHVVLRPRVIEENRVVVHVQPVIRRTVVVHRVNTIVKDVVVHRVNTTHQVRNEYFHETVDRYERGWTRHVGNYRDESCNCGNRRGLLTSHE
jgi:hypothetical protein